MLRALTVAPALLALTIGWFWQTPPAHAERKRFDGHQVVKVRITDEAELQTVYALEAASRDFDVWTDGIGVGVIDVRVSPQQKDLLDANSLTYYVIIEDVQALVDAERSMGVGFFEDFRTYDEHTAFMSDLAVAYPDLAQVVSLGTSIEGRNMWALRITGPGDNKPGVLYHGCEHAREWLTPPTIAFAAEHLLTNYATDPMIRTLVDNVEWFMMPIMNVDGYVYSWTTDRFWRKNRRNNGNGSFGVDLNRNWGRGWGGPGSSSYSWSDIYRGPSAFSEPETQAMRDFFLDNVDIRAYLDLHTTGNLLLWPWGYTSSLPPDHSTFSTLGAVMAGLVAAVHGTQYTMGTVYSTIYPASGISIDWVYGEQDRWAFTFELRGFGFAVPANQIIPAGEENLPAMLYFSAWTAACDPYASQAGLAMVPNEFDDCNGNGVADVCELADGGFDDCNGNFVPDECDIADGTSTDCDLDGIPDECGPDCNNNAVADGCDIVSGSSEDCNDNGVPDECDLVNDQCGPPIGSCPGEGDCLDPSGNGTPGCDCAACCYVVCSFDSFCCDFFWDDLCAWLAADFPECQIDGPGGQSEDCNENGIPDECEPDCNANDVPDDCDLASGTSDDCNDNDIVDDCEIDCNVNGTPDDCDLAAGKSGDCNANDVPDECEPDTDGDGVPDECDPCPIDNPDDFDGDGACNSNDECPNDPNKIVAGDCGCGQPDDDADGDDVSDCIDRCPGVDDALFAPECIDSIPAVSTWGLLALTLALLVAGKIRFAGLRPDAAGDRR